MEGVQWRKGVSKRVGLGDLGKNPGNPPMRTLKIHESLVKLLTSSCNSNRFPTIRTLKIP
eukprot:10172277-Karenia_brevis.AAC.1